MFFLLPHKSLECSNYDVVSAKVERGFLLCAVEPHPCQSIRFEMSDRLVTYLAGLDLEFTSSTACSKLPELFKLFKG